MSGDDAGPPWRRRGSGVPGAPVERNPGAAARIPADDRAEGLRLRAQALIWMVAWEVARRLPERVVFRAADLGGRVGHRCARAARARVRRNLGRVVDSAVLDTAVRDAFRSYARYWAESFRAADLEPADVMARTDVVGFGHLDATLDQGRGVIVLLAHHGSWDVAAAWAEAQGYHLAVVAEVLRPRALFARFVALREAIGLEVVPLRRGEDLVGRLRSVLEANHLVGLLSDRDLTAAGPVVELFGHPARIPPGPVVLSKRTGAPIVPITMTQEPGRRWTVTCLPPLDVSSGTIVEGCAAVAAAIETLIRVDPAQWHAFSPVWLEDLPQHRRGGWTPDAVASPRSLPGGRPA